MASFRRSRLGAASGISSWKRAGASPAIRVVKRATLTPALSETDRSPRGRGDDRRAGAAAGRWTGGSRRCAPPARSSRRAGRRPGRSGSATATSPSAREAAASGAPSSTWTNTRTPRRRARSASCNRSPRVGPPSLSRSKRPTRSGPAGPAPTPRASARSDSSRGRPREPGGGADRRGSGAAAARRERQRPEAPALPGRAAPSCPSAPCAAARAGAATLLETSTSATTDNLGSPAGSVRPAPAERQQAASPSQRPAAGPAAPASRSERASSGPRRHAAARCGSRRLVAAAAPAGRRPARGDQAQAEAVGNQLSTVGGGPTTRPGRARARPAGTGRAGSAGEGPAPGRGAMAGAAGPGPRPWCRPRRARSARRRGRLPLAPARPPASRGRWPAARGGWGAGEGPTGAGRTRWRRSATRRSRGPGSTAPPGRRPPRRRPGGPRGGGLRGCSGRPGSRAGARDGRAADRSGSDRAARPGRGRGCPAPTDRGRGTGPPSAGASGPPRRRPRRRTRWRAGGLAAAGTAPADRRRGRRRSCAGRPPGSGCRRTPARPAAWRPVAASPPPGRRRRGRCSGQAGLAQHRRDRGLAPAAGNGRRTVRVPRAGGPPPRPRADARRERDQVDAGLPRSAPRPAASARPRPAGVLVRALQGEPHDCHVVHRPADREVLEGGGVPGRLGRRRSPMATIRGGPTGARAAAASTAAADHRPGSPPRSDRWPPRSHRVARPVDLHLELASEACHQDLVVGSPRGGDGPGLLAAASSRVPAPAGRPWRPSDPEQGDGSPPRRPPPGRGRQGQHQQEHDRGVQEERQPALEAPAEAGSAGRSPGQAPGHRRDHAPPPAPPHQVDDRQHAERGQRQGRQLSRSQRDRVAEEGEHGSPRSAGRRRAGGAGPRRRTAARRSRESRTPTAAGKTGSPSSRAPTSRS